MASYKHTILPDKEGNVSLDTTAVSVAQSNNADALK